MPPTAHHRQQVVHLAMPHIDTSESQATNRSSCHANHKSRIVHLAMNHIDTSRSQATNRTSYPASHRYQQIKSNKSYILPCLSQMPAIRRQQLVHLTMPHTDTSKSQTTNRTSYPASHRYQEITGNKSYILPCLTQMPANHNNKSAAIKSQATNRTSCHASHRCQQITGNKSFILPCLHTYQQITDHRQQIVYPAMPHTDTSK